MGGDWSLLGQGKVEEQGLQLGHLAPELEHVATDLCSL